MWYPNCSPQDKQNTREKYKSSVSNTAAGV